MRKRKKYYKTILYGNTLITPYTLNFLIHEPNYFEMEKYPKAWNNLYLVSKSFLIQLKKINSDDFDFAIKAFDDKTLYNIFRIYNYDEGEEVEDIDEEDERISNEIIYDFMNIEAENGRFRVRDYTLQTFFSGILTLESIHFLSDSDLNKWSQSYGADPTFSKFDKLWTIFEGQNDMIDEIAENADSFPLEHYWDTLMGTHRVANPFEVRVRGQDWVRKLFVKKNKFIHYF